MTLKKALALACLVAATPATAQQAPTTGAPPPQTPPAAGEAGTPKANGGQPGAQLPPVEIIQEQPKPKPEPTQAPTPKKKKPVIAQPAPAPTPTTEPAAVTAATAPAGSVEAGFVRMSPVGGSELPIEKVPGGVSTVTAKDIERTGAVTVQDALQTRVPGVILSDIQGNSFQTDVQYRGFTSSPVNGQPQGIAIYQNGVRINEVWGDTVNWEFIPSNAINDLTLMSNNPVFGLNAIGGALSIGMKDGFTYQGAEIDSRFGSFGRRQIGVQGGQKFDTFAAYAALEVIHDSGWRDFSPTNIRRMYADVGAKGSLVEMHLNFTGAISKFGAVTAAPVELLDLRWANTYTSPQVTKSEMGMVSLNGTVTVTDTLKLSAVGYVRNFRQRRTDGNVTDAEDCAGFLCLDSSGPSDFLLDGAGNQIPTATLNGSPAGTLDRVTTSTESYGGSLQGVEKSKVFGLDNQFLIGASIDHGGVSYKTASELATIGPQFVLSGTGIVLSGPLDYAPRNVRATTDYYGIYFTDTLDLTERLSLTGGGRFNIARIELEDLSGNFPELTGKHDYSRFNPMIGATFKIVPGLSLYGGYSEANRAPTPVELACSDPNKPCILESFLTADPELKQVVSHTAEIGFRGELGKGGPQKLDWSLGFFRTLNTDDIIDVASPASGRGYFANAGDTLRQGIEASFNYREDRYSIYANYAFVDATFQTALELASPNNPSAVPCSADLTNNCINVKAGDHLPSVPAHRLKAGFDYWLTKQWKVGADLIVTSSQYFRGDEANQNAKLAGYERVDLHTSYDITPNIQVYGLIQNLFDKKYGLYGTYFDTQAATTASGNTINFTDPRTITPAQPFAAYGGLKVKF